MPSKVGSCTRVSPPGTTSTSAPSTHAATALSRLEDLWFASRGAPLGSAVGGVWELLAVKFSYRQILASAGGAVLSAVIASIFGVKGTIVGVAIGSIAATMGTALVFQSIERTNEAVKQVVVRVPDSTLLRRLGGTKATGVTRSEVGAESALHEETATSAAQASGTVGEPESALDDLSEGQTPGPRPDPRTNLRWPLIVGAVVGVFVFSLLLVTVVELIAGRPLADLFGHAGGGTTVEKIFESPGPSLPAPTTTTTTSSSTTTTSSSTTTSVVGSTTSSTAGGSTTTSSTGVSGTSSSTPTSASG